MNDNYLDESFGTLSETINGLVKLGYTQDFNITDESIDIRRSPEAFQIDKVYRFEGASDPDYQSILYAISSLKYNVKGTLVNGYGISSDEVFSKLVDTLQTNPTLPIVETSSNLATPQRPEGERILNAPFVELDLHQFIQQIKSETTWAESDRNSITIFKSDTMRMVLIGLHENAELPPHKANGVLSIQVLEGKMELTVEQKCIEIEKDQIIALGENVVHGVRALSECFFLLTLAMNRQ